MRSPHRLCAFLFVLAGCGSTGDPQAPDAAEPAEFVSDDPTLEDSSDEGVVADAGVAGDGDGDVDGDGEDPARVIAEADIVQAQGDRLYAFSRYGGLAIIDVSERDELRILGRFRTEAQPFEMYVRGTTVLAMFRSWSQYDESYESYGWVSTSQVIALDTEDPASIESIGEFSIPGAVSDSRLVGDVLYVVAHEDGYCWSCEVDTPRTTVLSLNVADPSAPQRVEQLAFEDQSYDWGWSLSSISVTTERMYVSSAAYQEEEGERRSSIQVVDISDPTGEMRLGASIPVEGIVESRWQMDEHEGVLRVITQAPDWAELTPPVIQTFTVASSDEVTPLGRTEMVLPRPEQLRSVRFDGDKAYAITFEQTDPLFTIDLSNPEEPRQVGELEIPGWIFHMEPRGDRIFAVGFDQENVEGTLNVSLFNVSDLAAPTLVQRVSFGGDRGFFSEDQDRIHKVFKLLDEQGLIAVPFSTPASQESLGTCESRARSGAQLIDFTRGSLTLRGVAESQGYARRAFIHDDRLFVVSDDQAQTFDIADRDAPELTAQARLARTVMLTAAAGDKLVRVGEDWMGAATLDVVLLSDAELPEPLGEVDLSAALEDRERCGFLSSERLFVDGDLAYVTLSGWTVAGESELVVAVDISDPTAPVVVSTQSVSVGDWPDWGQLANSGESAVRVGHSVVQHRVRTDWSEEESRSFRAWLDVVDFSDPEAPALTELDLPLREGWPFMHVLGESVYVGGFERLEDDKLRFFITHVDVSDPSAPEVVENVNVPGSLYAVLDAERFLTIDYARKSEQLSRPDCHNARRDARWESNQDATENGTCQWLEHSLRLVRLQDGVAQIEDSFELPDDAYLESLAVGEDRAFIALRGSALLADCFGSDRPCTERVEGRVLVLSGFSGGEVHAEQLSWTHPSWHSYSFRMRARGERAFAWDADGNAYVLDASDPSAPEATSVADRIGRIQHVELTDDEAICSLDYRGVATVSLD